jgi:hypothetical protein
MNIEDGDAVHQSIAAPGISAPKEARSKRRSRKESSKPGAMVGRMAGDSLSREARQLLTALGQPVGAGRFAHASADALVRQDLGCWDQAASGRKTLQLTKAGEAHLRRESAPESDMAFFHQHHETDLATVATEAGTTRVRVDLDESPLDWLRRRKGRDGEPMIDEASYQAGERLRTDIMLAGLLPGVTARWDGMPKSGGPASPGEATDRMVAARQRLRNAFDAIGGDFSDLLLDLCGFLKGLEQIERERQWPPRSGKIVVRLALARLAEHYGIEASARGPAASRGIRAWQAVVIEGGRV